MTLSEYIEEHGGTPVKRELAEKIGVRWATIHDIARGKSRPTPETAKKIAAATHGAVSVESLLGLDTNEAA